MGIGHEVLNVPFGQMVYQLASAIAESQVKLDTGSVEILAMMGNKKEFPVDLPIWDKDGEETSIETSMIGAGFQPTFYQFTDAIIEVKMAITMTSTSEYGESETTESKEESSGADKSWWKSKSRKWSEATTTTINANYTSKFSFKEEASSTLRVRIVPLPPNPIIQRLIDIRAKKQEKELEVLLKQLESATPPAM